MKVDSMREKSPDRFASLILVLAHAAISNHEVALQCYQFLSLRNIYDMLSTCERYDIAFSLVHFVTYVYIFEGDTHLKKEVLVEFINFLTFYMTKSKDRI